MLPHDLFRIDFIGPRNAQNETVRRGNVIEDHG